MDSRLKYFLFIVLFCVFIGIENHIKAQSAEFGISRGFNISTHTDKYQHRAEGPNVILTPKVTSDLYLGLIVRKKISSSLRLQIEPSLSVLGARYDESVLFQGEEFTTHSETQLKYLQLPLLLQIPISTSEKKLLGLPSPTTYHLTGGIFGGYLLDARFEGNFSRDITDTFSEDESFSDDVIYYYSKYDAGTILGAGMEYGTNTKIGFETRFQYTVLQTYRGTPRYKPKNMAVTFSLYLLL